MKSKTQQSNGGPVEREYIPSTAYNHEQFAQPSHASHTFDGTEDSDAIAIVGLALKFPQDAVDTESFWKLLLARRSALTKVPQERYNAAAFDVANQGHFIREDLGAFDAPFFSVSPAEAEQMDPQQRWLLETTYQALENAGITMDEVKNTQTSVHVGNFTHDFEKLTQLDTDNTERHKVIGSSMSILANRLSWFYDLHGPSVVVDTACSSSLVALHMACQSLKEGSSEMGIVAGVNLFFDPSSTADLGNIGFLSPDNICYSFDDRANGYSRGEGVGIVLIKPLSKALKDGNVIRAIIRATGSNQDGKTPGITQPSGKAQTDLIRATYKRAGLDMSSTRYFEAHGTGTAVGDPTEARAIADAFDTPHREPIYVGAVKSNIGHLEGASGIAGLIKSVLVLERGLIPANMWLERINPKIKPEEWGLRFPKQTVTWPSDHLRRASVNSFGFGGTNAHAIIDGADDYLSSKGLTNGVRPASTITENGVPNGGISGEGIQAVTRQVVTLSSFDEAGIDRLTSTMLKAHMGNSKMSQQHYLEDVAFTLNEKRTKLPWRSFATMSSKSSLQELVWSEPVRAINDLKLCFVFTGQGAQWKHMGQELLHFRVFRKSIKRAERFLRSLGCFWSLEEMLFTDNLSEGGYGDIDDARYSQPLCTIVQVALVDLLESWGVTPAIVVGHSSGEIAAAYCSKSISQEMAWKISYYRGLAVAEAFSRRSSKASMMAVQLSPEKIQPYLSRCSKDNDAREVTIACFNSPTNVTVSGTIDGLDELSSALEKDGVLFRRLKVPVGYHSSHMTEAGEIYRHYLQRGWTDRTQKEGPLFISTVTESQADPYELQSAEYWVANLVNPVKFSNVMRTILNPKRQKLYSTKEIDARYIVELGPHSTLRSPLKDIMKTFDKDISKAYSSALVRNQSAMNTILNCVGELSCAGYPVNLSAVNSELGQTQKPQLVTTLPPYPFNHSQSYWSQSRLAQSYRFRKSGRHELLGTPVPDWNTLEPRWNNTFVVQDMSFLNHHIVNGINLYPAAGMLVMAIEASRQLSDEKAKITGFRFKDVTFSGALPLSDGSKGTETQLFLRPTQESVGNTLRKWDEFRLCVWDNNSWRECCRGAITTEYASKSWSPSGADEHDASMTGLKSDVDQIREKCRLLLAKKEVYGALEKMGLTYGPTFQGLDNIRVDNSGSATGSVDLRHWKTVDPTSKCKAHLIHPAALDAVLQLAFPALAGAEGLEDFPTAVPTSLRSLWISSGITQDEKSSAVDVCATSRKTGLRDIQASFTVSNKSTGRIDLTIDACMTAVDRSVSTEAQELDPARRYYKVTWHPDTSLLKSANQLDLPPADRRKDSVTSKVEVDTYIKKEWLCLSAMTAAIEALPATYKAPKAHLQRYIDWMKRKLSAIKDDSSRYTSVQEAHAANPSQFHDLVKSCDAEGFILAKITTSLPQLLTGEVDSLQFLFSDDSLQAFYNQDWAVGVKDQVRSYARALGHKTPGLKVLEVGAGTGGLTTLVLEGLGAHPDNTRGTSYLAEYAYTDISPSFFMQAKQQFGEVNMKYQTLDIAGELDGQGFQEGYYDVVAASNVLHATADLDVTLKNCRRLLKPGGKLILHENMNPERITSGMIFGLLPGWWLSTEENRHWSPLQSRAEWNATLLRAGFSGEELLLEGTDERNLDTSPGAVMVSSAVTQGDPGTEAQQSTPPVMLIYDDSSEVQQAVRQEIENQHKTSQPGYQLTSHSLQTASTLDFSHANVLLLPSLDTLSLSTMTNADFSLLQTICSSANALLWIGRDLSPTGSPDTSMATGMGRALESENLDLSFITLTVSRSTPPSLLASHIFSILSQSPTRTSPTYENEYFERTNGTLYIPRVIENTPLTSSIHTLTSPSPADDLTTQVLQDTPLDTTLNLGLESVGLLNTFTFTASPSPTTPLAQDEVQIQPLAIGLNFVDVLTALGQVSRSYLGNELAGLVTSVSSSSTSDLRPGDVVIGCHAGTMASSLRCKAWQVHRAPKNMSVTDAAALPLVYCTVYYALVTWARAQPGESVLIHSGAGGVGQAAIQLAGVLGLTVYTTTSSEEKAALLRETYGIPAERIFNSRSLDFAGAIRRATGGKGVDIVLNSLSGEALRESFDLVAPFGRFVELGKRDIYATGASALGGLPMYAFSRNVMFASVDLPSLYLLGDRISGILKEVVRLAEDGMITAPKPVQVYGVGETEQAFRMMQGGKNVGKIVIDYEARAEVRVRKMKERGLFEGEATYVIAGGLGGIAKSIAKWMVKRGARNLVLLSRSTPKGSETEAFFQHLEMYGAKAVHFACDVADAVRMKEVFDTVERTMPPIKGCIHAAMVLENHTFPSLTLPLFLSPLLPKVPGTLNLHTYLPPSSFLILLSSHSGLLGAHGQSNYAAGNAYQDALARARHAVGSPTVSIDLGRVPTVGYVAEHDDVIKSALKLGIEDVSEREIFALLEHHCAGMGDAGVEGGADAEVDPDVDAAQAITPLALPALLRARGVAEPAWLSKPLLRHLHHIPLSTAHTTSPSSAAKQSWESLLRASTSWDEAQDIVREAICKHLADLLAIGADDVDAGKPVHAYGVDSLVAVELRNWFLKSVGADVPVLELLGGKTIGGLAGEVVRKSAFVSVEG